MKTILSTTAMALLCIAMCGGCSDSDTDSVSGATTKNVTYVVEATNGADENTEFLFKGYYLDAKGERVEVDAAVPWSLTLKDVSRDVKSGVGGYVFSINTSAVNGKASIECVDSKNGKPIYSNSRLFEISQDRPYTNEQLQVLTRFEFADM